MPNRLLLLSLAALCLGISGCAGPKDPDGIAQSTRALSDEQVALLPNGLSVAQLQARFGPGEAQAGSRVVYRAKDHPGEYYWVRAYGESASSVHHIVRADGTGEGGSVVWPAKWVDLSPRSAAYYLGKQEAGAD